MKSNILTLLASLAFGAAAFAGQSGKKTVAPPEQEDRWKLLLAMPGWMPAMEGNTGINGLIAPVDLDPGDIIRHYDMAASFRGEASKGRFGIMGEFLYTSLSDGIGTKTVVKKIDLQVDQMMAELALRWRIIDNPRGSLDLYGGVRYTNLFQQVVTQANAARIDEASTALVDAVSERLRNALANLDLRDLIADQLRTRIEGIDPGRPGQVPIGPIGGDLAERLRERVREILVARQGELRARVDAVQAAVGAARVSAQARLDDLKQDISDDIAREVESKLNARAARTDDWWDPFVGLRARYNFNDRFYLTGKGEVGGFGVGSDFTWQTEAALGCQLSKRVFTEIGYRAFGVDYQKDGLTYDVIMHGAQITMGIQF
jgi:hypothetical protein